MKRFKDYITERVSSIVYHATSFPSAVKALESDTLKGTENGISTTRSLTGQYHSGNALIGVIYILDGDAINYNIKGAPAGTDNYNYEDPNEDLYDDEERMTWKDIKNEPLYQPYHGRKNKQYEDVIKTRKLSPFIKYLKGAILFIPQEYFTPHGEDDFRVGYYNQIKAAPKAEELLKLNNVPIRYVTSEKGLYNRSNDMEGYKAILKNAQES